MKREYSALGWWKITTEGDCEGKTITDLGIHYGYLDDLAFSLGGKAYYHLNFEFIDRPVPKPEPSRVNVVHIQLGIDSGTWDLPSIHRAQAVRNILKDRPVVVGESGYYASVLLVKEINENTDRKENM